MAMKTNNTAIAVAIQSVVDTFTTPTQPGDLMPVSNCRLQIDGITIANDEYTGTPIRNADAVTGRRVTLSYNVKLRPPAGGSVPAANAFLLGRVLQAAKYTELRTASAIPASAEALSAGTTSQATLGAGAAATADLYKGMAISLVGMGADYKSRLTAIRSYTAAKVAAFCETFGSSITGTYQIPPQLGYMRQVSPADPIILSHSLWIDGYRLDLMNCRVSGLQIVIPTSTLDGANYPEIQVTYDCMIAATADQATPVVSPLGAVPLFKDGKGIFNGVRVGIATFTVDNGIQTENPPNPNKSNGSDAAEMVSATAMVDITMQKYLKATLDTLALADAQTQHAFMAQWGNGAGSMVQIVVPDARVDYRSPDTGGNIVMEGGRLMIDAFDRGICINFPF